MNLHLHHAILNRCGLQSRALEVVCAWEAIVKWQCQEAQLWSPGRLCWHSAPGRAMETSQRSWWRGVFLRVCFNRWTVFHERQCDKHSVH